MSEHWRPVVNSLSGVMRELDVSGVEAGEATRAVSSRRDRSLNPQVYPLTEPVVHTGTYKFDSIQHYRDILNQGGYIYSRCGNPTVEAAECAIDCLERGSSSTDGGTLLFSSGSSAIFCAVMANLRAGDHLICVNPVYSGVHKMMSKCIVNYGIDISWVKAGSSVSQYEKLIKPNTKLIHTETPCNPSNALTDLADFGALGGRYPQLVTSVDSTFASPVIQKPLSYGVDMVIHSCTKYVSGHNDVTAGSVSTRTLEMWRKLNVFRSTIGTTLSPFDASLLLRGVKTLPLRMERHSSNAMALAQIIEAHPKVDQVYYPGLPSFPQYEVAQKQMVGGYSGMITIVMKGGFEAARKVVEGVKLIHLAVSLGATESLLNHPASMTHGDMVMSDEERAEAGIVPGMIRFSVGLEDVEDLRRDLQQALDRA